MTELSYIITILTLIGTVANAFQKSWCFVIWICTNLFWTVYNILIKEYQQAVIYFVNFITSVIGLIQWTKNPKKTP